MCVSECVFGGQCVIISHPEPLKHQLYNIFIFKLKPRKQPTCVIDVNTCLMWKCYKVTNSFCRSGFSVCLRESQSRETLHFPVKSTQSSTLQRGEVERSVMNTRSDDLQTTSRRSATYNTAIKCNEFFLFLNTGTGQNYQNWTGLDTSQDLILPLPLPFWGLNLMKRKLSLVDLTKQ